MTMRAGNPRRNGVRRTKLLQHAEAENGKGRAVTFANFCEHGQNRQKFIR
jgi:hypothetical protein